MASAICLFFQRDDRLGERGLPSPTAASGTARRRGRPIRLHLFIEWAERATIDLNDAILATCSFERLVSGFFHKYEILAWGYPHVAAGCEERSDLELFMVQTRV